MNRKINTAFVTISLIALTGCETVIDQYGNQRQVMSPAGTAALNTLVATGIGAGSGALLKDQPGWLNGMVSSLSGSVASQLVDSVSNQESNQRYQNYRGYQGYQGYQGYSQPLPPTQYIQRGSYQGNNNYYGDAPNNSGGYPQNSQKVLYTRLPNGQFVPINP